MEARVGRSVAGLREIVALVEDDLVKVEAIFAEQVRSDVKLVGEIGRYVQEGGGKRVPGCAADQTNPQKSIAAYGAVS